MHCSRCLHPRKPILRLPLPLTGEQVALCSRCVVPAFISHMRSLVAPHG